MERMLLTLKPAAEQETALTELLRDQQDPTSPRYHQWITPQQFGEQFGPTQQDVGAVASWLQSHGFQVNRVANGRRAIEFSGEAHHVEETFQTEIHSYNVNGETHIANSTDITLPSEIGAVAGGVVSLHDFRSRPMHHRVPQIAPQFTDSSGRHSLTPYDFAAIYNLLPVWTGLSIDGTGQSIAAVSRSNIHMSDVTAFRSAYGLPGNNTQVILNGRDPGVLTKTGDDVEADLDVEWSGAIAKGATVKLIVSSDTATSDGIDLSNQYAVDNHVANIVSVSYGSCEAQIGSFNDFYSSFGSRLQLRECPCLCRRATAARRTATIRRQSVQPETDLR
jgi:subtilase family serine protease